MGAVRQDCTIATTVAFVLIVRDSTAFATGYAYAKASFEFARARKGVKKRAFGASADAALDTPACAITIV